MCWPTSGGPAGRYPFEQAAASFLKGLTVWYLLRKTYEIKPDEMFLFHGRWRRGADSLSVGESAGGETYRYRRQRRKPSAPKRRAPGR